MVASKDNQNVYSDTWNDYKKDDCTHIMSAAKKHHGLAYRNCHR